MPALHVVRRASTFLAADRRIARAMEFIRLHACEPGFAPPKVVWEMGISRSQADLLFRRVAGRSILNVIHDTRIARAQDLLRAGKSASYAADTCGFGSHVDFSRAFKRHVGTTVRAWTLARRGTTLSTSAKARH
jgi:AraC-like DNA-binding protein